MKGKRKTEEPIVSGPKDVEQQAAQAQPEAGQPHNATGVEARQLDELGGNPLSPEALLATISTRFISLATEEIDSSMDQALALIGKAAAVDRCLIFLYRGGVTHNAHQWCTPAVEPDNGPRQRIPSACFSWWREKMTRLEPIYLLRLADLPPEAEAEKVALQAQQVQSIASIPLAYGKTLFGYLRLDTVGVEKSWTDTDVTLLEATGKILASVLERKGVEERQRASNQRLLQELKILRAVAASTEVSSEDELIERFTRLIGETLQPDNFGVLLLDEVNNVLRVHPSYQGPRRAVPLGRGLVGTVASTGQPRRLADVSHEPIYLKVDAATRSELCVPLKVGQHVIGVVNAESKRISAFSEADEHLLVTLANQLAAEVERIRLFHKMAEALIREQQLYEIMRSLSSASDLPTILIYVVQMATDLVDAHAGLLGLVIDSQIMTFYPYNVPSDMNLQPAPKGRGVAWQIAETRESLLLNDYAEHPDAQQRWINVGVKAFLGVPIAVDEQYLGALLMFNLYTEKRFTERDKALAESVAQQAGIAIQNVRMYTGAQQRASALAAALNRQEELDNLKNRFIHSVSHELRAPLGIIYGHAELLDSGDLGELLPEQAQSVRIIARRAQMLTNLVDDLSALLAAETQELRRQAIDPVQLVYSMLADYRMKAEEAEITLKAEIAETLPWLIGDVVHLRRVFDNLVSNAFKFTPAGGSVTLRMEVKGQDVMIEVSDTGAGIAAEELPRIFERFYQVKNASRGHTGTGLGLALVKEIVEAHRGHISVESEVGKGTTFCILLPGQEPTS